ncbi:multidrug resistance-associated protein [Mariannaea sp. PMI_226]|nr:multidrug resistance-associated protein [Mariannaea sp. PMI_226]
MSFSSCSSDATFGPVVKGCRDDFDFTLTFERIFLSLVPSSLFVVASVVRGLWLVRKPTVVKSHTLQVVKVACVAYAALRLALLVLISSGPGRHARLFVPSAVLESVASVAILALSLLEHSRSLRPSTILAAYLLLALLFDITQTRSLYLAAESAAEHRYAHVFTAATVVNGILVVTESKQKSRLVPLGDKRHGPEDTSGLYSLSTFFWVNTLFLRGYKKLLTDDDLLPLGQTMSTKALGQKLDMYLEAHPTRGRKGGLTMALSRILAVPLLLPVAPRLALLGFTFSQPFLIHAVLSYLVSTVTGSENKHSGYGLIGATIFIYLGIAFSTALQRYLHERTMWMARGALAHSVYRKAMQLKISNADDSAALTLMSTDIERIRIGFKSLHDFWASPIEIALGSWMLYNNLGITFLAPIVLVAVCVLFVALLITMFGSRQAAWMTRIEKRVGATSHLIANMKHLKIAGLTGPVETLVQHLREDEIRVGGKWRGLMIVATFIGFTPVLMGPVITFALTSRDLNVTRLFTSLSFLTFLTIPLTQLIQFVPPLLASFTCLDRIQTFLEKDARVDFRDFSTGPVSEKLGDKAPKEGTSVAIEILNGSFGWDEGSMVLQDLNLQIPASGLTMVVGPVASGKTTLCKALLGETPNYSGHVTVGQASRVIGYCEQVPFISNATIRDNIIGYSPFNAARYDEVVYAAMLMPDLAVLPLGDGTQVGSNGITLSGGQKQRVSMARALYLETDLVIFDDVFSGLDADTTEHVFSRVFGLDGLIRSRKATAVVCTHSVRHLPSADHVIALGSDGRIVEQGSFENLIANEAYVHSLGVTSTAKPSPSSDATPQSLGDLFSEAEGPPPLSIRPSLEASRAPRAAEKLSRQVGDRTVYKHYAKSNSPITLLSFLFVDAAIGFLWNYPQIWLTNWADDVVANKHSHPQAYWVGIYALLSGLCLVFIAIAGVLVLVAIVAQSGTRLHHAALRTVFGASLRFFTKTDAGVVTNLFSQDMTLIDTELPQALLNLMISIFVVIGMAAVVITSSPYIAISYPFLLALMWVVQRFYLRTSRQLRLMELEAKSPLYTQFTDTLTGVATLRAFGWVDASLELNNKFVDTSQTPAYLLAMIQHWLTLMLQLVVAILATLVVVLTTQVNLASRAGYVGASLVTLMSFGETFTILILMYTLLETSLGAVSRLKSFSEDVIPESASDDQLTEPPPSWPSHGAIEIKNVSASYDAPEDALSDESLVSRNLALNDLNISISCGEKVAICGRTGSGKSSIILLLLRLLDPVPESGSQIEIDGVPLHQVDRSLLRHRVIAVPQDAVFFPDGTSVKANLDPFDASTAEECREVLEAVGLWRSIEERGGLDGGTTADTYSQGQKQLFSLARAILRRRIRSREALKDVNHVDAGTTQGVKGLLLLDEVSASVDKDTEREMQAIIKREFADYTVVMVSHRLDIIMNSDTVFVIEAGSVVESGNPQELMGRQGSHLQKLWVVEADSEQETQNRDT